MSDYIKRDDVKYALNGACVLYNNETIDRIPSADVVEVRHGRWEKKDDPYGFFDKIPVCSECGCTTELRKQYAYCPNCGADMRGDKE